MSRVLVEGHVLLALAAASWVYLAMQFGALGDRPAAWRYLVWVASNTLALYGLHRWLSWLRLPAQHADQDRWRAVGQAHRLSLSLALLGGFGGLAVLPSLDWAYLRLLVPGVLVGAAYVLPIFGGRRLRDWGALKLPSLAVTFVGLTLLVPLLARGWWRWEVYLLAVSRMLFFAAHTLAFDYRDQDLDRSLGVRTLPSALGRRTARAVSLVLLSVGSATLVYVASYGPSLPQALVLVSFLLTDAVTAGELVYGFRRPRPRDRFYGLVLDGTLLLPALLYRTLSVLY